MTAKKIARRRTSSALPRKKRIAATKAAQTTNPLSSAALELLSTHAGAMSEGEMALALHLRPRQLPLLHKALVQLLESRTLVKKGKLFSLAAPSERVQATIDITAKGFGFAVLAGERAQKGKDVFIAPHNLNGASHGDTVLIALTGSGRGRREGRVIQILERAVTQLCGLFTTSPRGGVLLPDDERLPYTVFIPHGETLGAEEGMAVVAEILEYGSDRQGPTGRVVEILGDARTASVQIRMALFQAGVHQRFPAEVVTEAAGLLPVSGCEAHRTDLRQVPHVTIDGATARDFDDAICVERQAGGYILYVSIADVSHYVTVGSAIDREAYARGTSIYLPDRVLPMLPERLSNDLCSLVPDQDRPAFTAILSFDAEGRRTGERYCKSLIRSRHRFTYDTVYQILEAEPQSRAAHPDLVPMLETAVELTALLKQRRVTRGSLEFNIPEPEVRLRDDQVADIGLATRNRAHMLIEDCMLAANEAVAETLARAQRPVLYRIHEFPDPAKLETFTDAAKALGLTLPRTEVSPAWFAQVLAQAQGTDTEYIVNTLLLRTMQQARYAPENKGHFGLAATYYLHFTSPIRRYPDLVVHRVLQAMLLGQPVGAAPPIPTKSMDLAEAGLHLSLCERKAIDLERGVHTRCAALFLLGRVGEEFSAIISGVTAYGLYVTLDASYISGLVPLTSMTDDYYLFDSRRYRMIGEGTNRMYQLGDRVQVRLDHVDLAARRLNFSLLRAAKIPQTTPAPC